MMFPTKSKVEYGSSRQEDKEALLARAAREREARKQAQSHGDSAIRIQRRFRIHRQFNQSKHGLRAEFDALWASYTAKSKPGAAADAKEARLSSLMLDLVKLLPLFYDASTDNKRLLSVCAAIVKGTMPASRGDAPKIVDRERNYFSNALSSNEVLTASFCLATRRLVVLLLTALAQDSAGPTIENSQVFGLMLGCLSTALDSRKWELFSLALGIDVDKRAKEQAQLDRVFWQGVFAKLCVPEQRRGQFGVGLYQHLHTVLLNLWTMPAAQNIAATPAPAPAPTESKRAPVPAAIADLGPLSSLLFARPPTVAKPVKPAVGNNSIYVIALVTIAFRGLNQPAAAASSPTELSGPRTPVEPLFVKHILTLPSIAAHFAAPANRLALNQLTEFQQRQWKALLTAAHAMIFADGVAAGPSEPAWAANAITLPSRVKLSTSPKPRKAAAAPARPQLPLSALACLLGNLLQLGSLLDTCSPRSSAALLLTFTEVLAGLLELCTQSTFSRHSLRQAVPDVKDKAKPATLQAPIGLFGKPFDSKDSKDSKTAPATTASDKAAEGQAAELNTAVRLRLVDSFSEQISLLFRAETFTSFLLATVSPNAGKDLLSPSSAAVELPIDPLVGYALTLASTDETTLVLQRFTEFSLRHPAFMPAVARLYRLAFEKCRQARLTCLSLLSFSSPLLVCLWRWMELEIGSTISAFSAPLPAAVADYASPAVGLGKGRIDPLLQWEAVFWSALSGDQLPEAFDRPPHAAVGPINTRALLDALDVFVSCYSPVLFVLEDEELTSLHLPFDSLHTLSQFAKLLKTVVFRMLWEQNRVPAEVSTRLLAPCRQLVLELYSKDVRCSFMVVAARQAAQAASASDAAQAAAAARAKEAAAAKAKSSGFRGWFGRLMSKDGSASKGQAGRQRLADDDGPGTAPAQSQAAGRGGYAQLSTAADEPETKAEPTASTADSKSPRSEQTSAPPFDGKHWLVAQADEAMGGSGKEAKSKAAASVVSSVSGAYAEWHREWSRWLQGPGSESKRQRATLQTDEFPTPSIRDGMAPERVESDTVDSGRLMSVLQQMPFVVPFESRVALLRRLVDSERWHVGGGALGLEPAICAFVVRRKHVLEDAFVAVSKIGAAFRHRVMVRFVDEDTGQEEKGVDLGGPFKEFLEMVCKEVFRVERGLFRATPSNGMLHPAPDSAAHVIPDFFRLMHFVGRVVGKALYDGVLIDLPFAPFFLAKLLGQPSVLSDLSALDPTLYKSLMFVKHYQGSVADLSLTFAVSDEEFGQSKTVELRPGGLSVTVDESNRVEYIFKVADYHLNRKSRAACAAFVSGFADMIDLRWVRMFNTNELQLLISGSLSEISVADWREHTVYEGCSASDKAVKWFWSVLEELSPAERQSLLRFATSCSRPPLMGFKHLQPPFTIRVVSSGDSIGSVFSSLMRSKPSPAALPSSSTCFNLLKLPNYATKATMAEKLRLAIKDTAGFHVS